MTVLDFQTISAQIAGFGAAVSGNAKPDNGDFPATLLAIAGHDLRQPLQAITNAHDLVARIVDGGEQRKQLARAEDATARLAGIGPDR